MAKSNVTSGNAATKQSSALLHRTWARAAFSLSILVVLSLFTPSPVSAQDGKSVRKIQGSRSFNPIYPYEALIAGKGGWAEISYTVDYTGRAIFLATVGASDPAFAHAFQADIEAIEFIPPRINGQPQMTPTQERFDFPAQPPLDPIAREILVELRKPHPALVPVAELDAKPEAIRRPPPAYPWVLRGDSISGSAEIEFVVDRNGRCLFPRIVSATQDDFGWAAATGVLRWRYKPPTKGGAKADTRITETIVFDINKSSDMW
ncbi:MAG: TonB family protein [Nibricoccus sp.]